MRKLDLESYPLASASEEIPYAAITKCRFGSFQSLVVDLIAEATGSYDDWLKR